MPPYAEVPSSLLSFGVPTPCARPPDPGRTRVGGEQKRPTVAGEVGHRRVADENFGSREGKRQARHGEPVLGQRSATENAERLRRQHNKGQRLIKSTTGRARPSEIALEGVV